MNTDEKVRENRLRRVAERRGWRVVRVPIAYLVLDSDYRVLVGRAGDLDELEDIVTATRRAEPPPVAAGSNRQIAAVAGVSPDTVDRTARNQAVQRPRLGADNKVQPVDALERRRQAQAARDRILRRMQAH